MCHRAVVPGPDPAVDAFLEQVTGPRADAGKGAVHYRLSEDRDPEIVRSILEMTAATTGPIS